MLQNRYPKTRIRVYGIPPTVTTATALIVLLLSALPAAASPLTGPRISAAQEVFDFGYVPQNAFISHTFWLRNSGTETVKIQKVEPNCGCTQAPLTDSVIAVGDSIPVELIFGSRQMIGSVEKHARIFSNAAGRVPALTIRANVVAADAPPLPLTLSPWHVIVDSTWESKTGVSSRDIQLRNGGGAPLDLSAIDIPRSGVALSSASIHLEPQATATLGIRFTQRTTASFVRSVTLALAAPEPNRVTVPISRKGAR